jgi:hypothetical protein
MKSKEISLIPRRQGKNGNLLPITLKEQAAFDAVIAAELAPYLTPESDQDDLYYHLECDFGTLCISKPYSMIEGGEFSYWIFIQLRGPKEQLKAAIDSGLDCNPYSGKWNINCVDHPQDAIDQLKHRLKRVNAKLIALHVAAKDYFSIPLLSESERQSLISNS